MKEPPRSSKGAASPFLGVMLALAFVGAVSAQAQPGLEQRILLIGDAGAPDDSGEPTLATLTRRAAAFPQRTLVVFLGDNIYENGLADLETDPETWKDGVRRISGQLNVVTESGATGWFLPGNHDWDNGGDDGQNAIARQEAFVENVIPGGFVPSGGCPGPIKMDFVHLRIIAFDSQWWVHEKTKPLAECFPEVQIDGEEGARVEFLKRVDELVATAGPRRLLMLAHHPLDTHGAHGGYFNWQDHIFPLTRAKKWLWVPLPLVGSLYPIGRRHLIKSNQDLVGPRNRELVEAIEQILKEKAQAPVLFAGGHEHSLQVLRGHSEDDRILVSGLGSQGKATPVTSEENTVFVHREAGFMELDILEDGEAVLRVYDGSEGATLYEEILPKISRQLTPSGLFLKTH